MRTTTLSRVVGGGVWQTAIGAASRRWEVTPYNPTPIEAAQSQHIHFGNLGQGVETAISQFTITVFCTKRKSPGRQYVSDVVHQLPLLVERPGVVKGTPFRQTKSSETPGHQGLGTLCTQESRTTLMILQVSLSLGRPPSGGRAVLESAREGVETELPGSHSG